MDLKSSKKILIVDSLRSDCILLSAIFIKDYSLIEAYNETDAVEALNSIKDINAILLNVMEPDLDGYHLLQYINEHPAFSYIPIVAITDGVDEESQIRALDSGASDIISKPFRPKLVLHRINSIISRAESTHVIQQNELYRNQLKQQEKYIHLSEIDTITGIYNKSAFCHHASELIKNNPDKHYVILRFDIDHYKVFKDIYGIQEGQYLLRSIAKMLEQNQKWIKIYGHLEGDHYIVCIEKSYIDMYIEKFADFIKHAIGKNYPDFEIISRIGLYVVSDPELDINIMCDRALLALYSIKGTFSTSYAYYEDSMRQSLIEEQKIVKEVTLALQSDQFLLYLQPQINYSEKKIIGAEALVRWNHPTKGMILPGRFISLLERNGLISKLDEFIWEAACKQLHSWLDLGFDSIAISVNISRVDIYNLRLCDIICSLVKRYNVPPHLLHLEITESAYMDNSKQLINVVKELQQHGFIVEMDDFGSGYSSLHALKDVPVNVLKLDLKFLRGNENQSRGGNILSSIVRMTHWLQLPVIAEGVETAEQAEYLKSIGCLLMQGYFFAGPMPVKEFEKLLIKCGKTSKLNIDSRVNIKEAADFWDATAQSTILFNSFVGGAAIIEYRQGQVEIIRTNDKYFEVLETTREDYIGWEGRFMERFIGSSRDTFTNMLEEAIKTGQETSCETQNNAFVEGGSPMWIHTRARLLAQKDECYIFYLSIGNITEYKRLLHDNAALSQQLSSIMQSIPGGILTLKITNKIEILYFNDAFPKMFGFEEDEYKQLFRQNVIKTAHPDDRRKILQAIQDVLKNNENSMNVIYRSVKKDGSYLWIRVSGKIMNQTADAIYACAVITDINDLVLSHQIITEQSEKIRNQRITLKNVCDAAPCGIIQYEYSDNKLSIVDFNDMTWKLFGYSSAEAFLSEQTGFPIERIHPDDKATILSYINKVLSTKENTSLECRIIHKDGSIRFFRLFLQIEQENNNIHSMYSMFMDITKQKMAVIGRYNGVLFSLFDYVIQLNYSTNTITKMSFREESTTLNELCGNIQDVIPSWIKKYATAEDRDSLMEFIYGAKPPLNSSKSITYRIFRPHKPSLWLKSYMINMDDSVCLICSTDINNIQADSSILEA